MRHLISPLDFTVEETYEVLDFADRIAANPKAYAHAADGRQLATLFYEPSTRTRLSFESAMLSLGGQTIGFAGAEQSSVSKGETIADTVRVVSCYADIIAMRHPKEGAPLCASMYSKIPVINAGDGGHNHPTQTLIDLMTIRQRLDDRFLWRFEVRKNGALTGEESGAPYRKQILFYLARRTQNPGLSCRRNIRADAYAV